MIKASLYLIIVLIIAAFSLAGCKEEAKTEELEAKIAKLEEEIEAAKEEAVSEEENEVEEADDSPETVQTDETFEEEMEKEEEKFGLKALIIEQEWIGMPAGTEVAINEESAIISRDLAGVEVILKIQNNSLGAEILFQDIYLERADGIILNPFYLRQLDGTEVLNGWPDEGIKFEPNQTRVLKLASTFTAINKLEGDLFINHDKYKWKLKVDPLPPYEEIDKIDT